MLYERGYREAVLAVTELLPSYGYWKDLLLLLLECKRADVDYTPLHSKVRCLFARQLKADAEELEAAAREGRQPRGLSLAAKFAPSEGGQYSRSLKADKQICRLLYTCLVGVADEEAAWGYRRAKYRRMLSSLRRALALPEVLMCAQQWTEIDLSSVPSLAMARYKRAYLNEGKGCCKDDPERAACRDNFVKMLQEKGVSALKGKLLFPPQASIGGGSAHAQKPRTLFWGRGFCGSLACLERAVGGHAHRAAGAGGGQKGRAGSGAVGSCRSRQRGRTRLHDSMGRTGAVRGGRSPGRRSRVRWRKQASWPLTARVHGRRLGFDVGHADACGHRARHPRLRGSHPTFRDNVLTFSSDPVWHRLDHGAAFVDKVRSLASAHWGMSTDFAKAMRKIAEMVCSERLEQHDVPDLLVVSDMQFDQARFEGGYGDYFGYGKVHSAWDTVYEEIAQLFHEVGMQVHGRPLSAPNIIFWNVRPTDKRQQRTRRASCCSPATLPP